MKFHAIASIAAFAGHFLSSHALPATSSELAKRDLQSGEFVVITENMMPDGSTPYSTPEAQALLNDFAASIGLLPDLSAANSLAVSTTTSTGQTLELLVECANDAPTLASYSAEDWVATVARFVTEAVGKGSPYDYTVFVTNGEDGTAVKDYAVLMFTLE